MDGGGSREKCIAHAINCRVCNLPHHVISSDFFTIYFNKFIFYDITTIEIEV